MGRASCLRGRAGWSCWGGGNCSRVLLAPRSCCTRRSTACAVPLCSLCLIWPSDRQVLHLLVLLQRWSVHPRRAWRWDHRRVPHPPRCRWWVCREADRPIQSIQSPPRGRGNIYNLEPAGTRASFRKHVKAQAALRHSQPGRRGAGARARAASVRAGAWIPAPGRPLQCFAPRNTRLPPLPSPDDGDMACNMPMYSCQCQCTYTGATQHGRVVVSSRLAFSWRRTHLAAAAAPRCRGPIRAT